MATVIKLGKKDDIVSVIRRIKDLKDKEVVFELEKGSLLLSSSANLKLIKRTGETLGKKVSVTTDDELGRLLAIKAGVLLDQTEEDVKRIAPRARMFSQTKRTGVGDLRAKRTLPKSVLKVDASPLAKYLTKGLPKPRFAKVYKTGLISLLALAIIVGVVLIGLPQANVVVYARSEPISRDIDLRVDKSASEFNPDTLTVPGKLIVRELSQTKNYPVTGTRVAGEKASGEVGIYNGTNNTLKLFSQNSNPNQPVPIVAAEGGERYNLSSQTRLEIKNAALGNRPEVYAVSGEITGGTSSAQLALSREDLDKALIQSTEDLIKTAETELNAETPGHSFISSGAKVEVLAQTANKNLGDAAENFDFTVIARISGLVFKQSDASGLISQQINSLLSEDKYLVEGAEQKLTTSFKSLDLGVGIGTLAVHFETLVAYKIDQTNLSRILSGKKASEIKEILLSKPEIDRVDVKFSPFFVRKAPRFNGRIQIETVLSQF